METQRCTDQRSGQARHRGPFSRDLGLCAACTHKRRVLSGKLHGSRSTGNTTRGAAKLKAGAASSGNATTGAAKRKAGAASSGNATAGVAKRTAGAASSGNPTAGVAKRKAGAASAGNATATGAKRTVCVKGGKRSGVRRRADIALVVKKPWLKKIFDGTKTWEIRGSKTTRRGTIHLAQSGGRGELIGSARLVDCVRVPRAELMSHRHRHCIPKLSIVKYREIYAWVLRDARRYGKPFKYSHPGGASVWVRV